jgi:hypothetical protein
MRPRRTLKHTPPALASARQEAANANRSGRQTEGDFGAADEPGPLNQVCKASGRRVNRPPRKEKSSLRERQQKHHTAAAIAQGVEQGMRRHASRPYQPQPEEHLAGMTARDNASQSGGHQDQKKRRMKEAAMCEKAVALDAKHALAYEIEIGSRGEQARDYGNPPSRQNSGHLCQSKGRQRQCRANQEMSGLRAHRV